MWNDLGTVRGAAIQSRFAAQFAVALALLAQAAFAGEVRVLENLAYKTGDLSDYEQTRCKLDLFLPAEGKDFPTVVWFHGGGLTGGDKSSGAAFGRSFAKQGLAVASVNYRLSPQAKYPAYIEDAAAAVAFVRETIPKHGGTTKSIFVAGHSAGGYLTAMVGGDPRYLAKHGLKREELAGLIPISGQMITHFTVRAERGIDKNHPLLDEAGPAFHVAKTIPPTLAVAAEKDMPARAEESRYYVAALKATGHEDATYREFAGRDHGTVGSEIGKPNDEVAAAVLAFIRRLRR